MTLSRNLQHSTISRRTPSAWHAAQETHSNKTRNKTMGLAILSVSISSASTLGSSRKRLTKVSWSRLLGLLEWDCLQYERDVVQATGSVWGLIKSTGTVWGLIKSTGTVWGLIKSTGTVWGLIKSTGSVWGLIKSTGSDGASLNQQAMYEASPHILSLPVTLLHRSTLEVATVSEIPQYWWKI